MYESILFLFLVAAVEHTDDTAMSPQSPGWPNLEGVPGGRGAQMSIRAPYGLQSSPPPRPNRSPPPPTPEAPRPSGITQDLRVDKRPKGAGGILVQQRLGPAGVGITVTKNAPFQIVAVFLSHMLDAPVSRLHTPLYMFLNLLYILDAPAYMLMHFTCCAEFSLSPQLSLCNLVLITQTRSMHSFALLPLLSSPPLSSFSVARQKFSSTP